MRCLQGCGLRGSARGHGWFVIVTFLLLLFPTDRRFYPSKYDARKALEAYSLKLRNETDIEALNDDLVGVVRETMQLRTSLCGYTRLLSRRVRNQISSPF